MNVGKLEHIRDILNQYEKSIIAAEQSYNYSYSNWLQINLFSNEINYEYQSEHEKVSISIETQATVTLERIKEYLCEKSL